MVDPRVMTRRQESKAFQSAWRRHMDTLVGNTSVQLTGTHRKSVISHQRCKLTPSAFKEFFFFFIHERKAKLAGGRHPVITEDEQGL